MANDFLLTSIDPQSTIAATTTGAWVYVGKYKDVRSRVIVGGDVTGTNPTLIVTIEGSTDGSGAADATLGTHATIIDEMVGYVDASPAAPMPSVPGEDPIYTTVYTGANPWIRHVATIGGTASPTFPLFTSDFEVLSTATLPSGRL